MIPTKGIDCRFSIRRSVAGRCNRTYIRLSRCRRSLSVIRSGRPTLFIFRQSVRQAAETVVLTDGLSHRISPRHVAVWPGEAWSGPACYGNAGSSRQGRTRRVVAMPGRTARTGEDGQATIGQERRGKVRFGHAMARRGLAGKATGTRSGRAR